METSLPRRVTAAELATVRPTRSTLFWRTFPLWQFVRFLIVNLRMTRIILNSHDTTPSR